MKLAVGGAVLCIAMAPLAVAQTGGYPASPSHGVVGTNPDGTPRYGSEPGKAKNPPPDTVGRSNSGAPDDHGAARGGEEGSAMSKGSGNNGRR